ncbi:MAG: copper amine oxidase N-terminal domain-containing protein, partial [Candidatus Metalachnospira sp.]|nr:copper amine oxidase N-terminal domain-containing protein [Candidatus Metalachnospira sp.]
KKLALLMAAIMTVAMVPATAFASTKLTAVDEVTTGVDKIFASRVELKKGNDQVGIGVTPTFDVYATLTNGKFAKVDDDDDRYQMDSVTGPATYNWEDKGIVAVEVISDTKAKVTLQTSVFNQSDDNYATEWKADWKATYDKDATADNKIYDYWKNTPAASGAAEAKWVADTAVSATLIKDKWTTNPVNQEAVANAWKTNVDNKGLVEDQYIATWLADPANVTDISTWDSAYVGDPATKDADRIAWVGTDYYTPDSTTVPVPQLIVDAQNAAWLAYTDKTDEYETAYTAASTTEPVPQSITDAQDHAWDDVTATVKEPYFVSAYADLRADGTAYGLVATAAADKAYTDANPAADSYTNACVLPIIAKAVDTGDVVVKFTSNVSAFKSASEVIATVVDGDAEVTVEGVRTFVEDGNDEDTVKEITINELTPATLVGNDITLKLKGDWKYVNVDPTISFLNQSLVKGTDYTIKVEDDIITIKFTDTANHGKNLLKNDGILTKMTITGIKLETTKKCNSGDVATITVSSKDFDSVKLEVAKMVEEAVTYSVEDKTLPTIWAGKNYAIDDETNTLKLSIVENAGDILNTSRKATFTFPEGIEVVGIADTKGLTGTGNYAFKYEIDENVVTIYNYQKGASESSDNKVNMSLKFILNAAPTFSGDVTVTLGGQFDDTSFKVAKVKAPYTVEAKTSEVLIDYRYVPVNDIVITEAEDGILKDGDKIVLAVEKMNFEDAGNIKVTDGDIDVDVDVDSKGDAYLYEDKDADYLVVTVNDESTEASTIVISGLELYLDRTLPVGGYALTNVGGTFNKHSSYDKDDVLSEAFSKDAINVLWENSMDVKDIYDYTPDAKAVSNGIFKYKSVTANDKYVDVITAARDQDDSMTTKKVVITVGATTMAAGTATVTLDAPAYINAANYTMLPLRAITEAFGATVNWDDASKTVTIMGGQRIISMTIGSKTMYINGTPVAMNTAPEITSARTFVPVRDLANALGISNINWTETSGTVTLN